MDKEKATEQIMIRVPSSLKNRLQTEAALQNRPLANYIKAILLSHFETIDRLKKISEKK